MDWFLYDGILFYERINESYSIVNYIRVKYEDFGLKPMKLSGCVIRDFVHVFETFIF